MAAAVAPIQSASWSSRVEARRRSQGRGDQSAASAFADSLAPPVARAAAAWATRQGPSPWSSQALVSSHFITTGSPTRMWSRARSPASRAADTRRQRSLDTSRIALAQDRYFHSARPNPVLTRAAGVIEQRGGRREVAGECERFFGCGPARPEDHGVVVDALGSADLFHEFARRFGMPGRRQPSQRGQTVSAILDAPDLLCGPRWPPRGPRPGSSDGQAPHDPIVVGPRLGRGGHGVLDVTACSGVHVGPQGGVDSNLAGGDARLAITDLGGSHGDGRQGGDPAVRLGQGRRQGAGRGPAAVEGPAACGRLRQPGHVAADDPTAQAEQRVAHHDLVGVEQPLVGQGTQGSLTVHEAASAGTGLPVARKVASHR